MTDRSSPADSRSPVRLSDDDVGKFLSDIEEAEENRSEWVANQVKLTEQRYCLAVRPRDVPWPGASNLRLPTQDKAIKRWSARILSLVLDAEPVAYFRALEPGDVAAARLVEQFYTWLFRIHMSETTRELAHLADIIAHRGFGFVQVFWDYRVEREQRVLRVADLFPEGVEDLSPEQIAAVIQDQYQTDDVPPAIIEDIVAGAPEVVLSFSSVVSDRPRIAARDPVHVLAPAAAVDVEDAAWIAVEHLVDDAFLREGVHRHQFSPDAVDRCLDRSASGGGPPGGGLSSAGLAEQRVFDRLSGSRSASELEDRHRVFELYTWVDDGRERYRAVLWIHAGQRVLLAAHPFVYPFHRWPFVRFDFERTAARHWHAPRGLSHKLSALARSINKIHNARQDAIDIQLAPVFKVRGAASVQSFQYGPGRFIPVAEMSDIEPFVQDLRNLGAYLQEEHLLRSLAEDYAGTIDASLMSAMRPTERRTATEVSTVAEQIQGIMATDAKLFQAAMAEVHRLVWELWYEWGSEQIFFRVMNEEQPRLLRKSEVAAKYDIVPAGTLANTTKALELARAREALQFFAADQSGVVDRAELFRWYLGLLDWTLARRIVRSSEEQRAYGVLMQAANEIASGQIGGLLHQASASIAAAPAAQEGEGAQ